MYSVCYSCMDLSKWKFSLTCNSIHRKNIYHSHIKYKGVYYTYRS